MNFIKSAAVFILILMLSSCGITRKDTDEWLETKNSASSINMTGEWDSGGAWSGGWGGGKFIQEGRKFSGSLGMYYAEGVVSGDEIYMVLYSGRSVYYTAILRKAENGGYMGKAVYVALADGKDAKKAQSYLISLKKVTR